jgi:hypothetical protein
MEGIVWIADPCELAVTQIWAIDFTMTAVDKNNTGWAVIACTELLKKG